MRATCSSEIMRDLLKRIHPVSSATADPADDPAGRPFRLRRGTTVRRWDGLDGFSQPRRGQIRTARGMEGRWIRHAGTLALSVLALYTLTLDAARVDLAA